MKIYSWSDRPEPIGEQNKGESEVDLALFVPSSKRIQEYIRSGEMLEDIQRVKYHSDYLENLQDENFEDPYTYRGYDRVELELMHKQALEDIKIRMNAVSEDKKATESSPENESAIESEKTESVENNAENAEVQK